MDYYYYDDDDDDDDNNNNNNNNNKENFNAECLTRASYSGGPKFRPLPGNRLH
jgi:hypothetical protein